MKPDALKAYRGLFGHTQRASKIQITFCVNRTISYHHTDRCGDCAECHTCTGDERFQQHIARTGQQPIAACGWMKTSLDQCFACLDSTRDALAQAPLGFQRDQGGSRLFAILFF